MFVCSCWRGGGTVRWTVTVSPNEVTIYWNILGSILLPSCDCHLGSVRVCFSLSRSMEGSLMKRRWGAIRCPLSPREYEWTHCMFMTDRANSCSFQSDLWVGSKSRVKCFSRKAWENAFSVQLLPQSCCSVAARKLGMILSTVGHGLMALLTFLLCLEEWGYLPPTAGQALIYVVSTFFFPSGSSALSDVAKILNDA